MMDKLILLCRKLRAFNIGALIGCVFILAVLGYLDNMVVWGLANIATLIIGSMHTKEGNKKNEIL